VLVERLVVQTNDSVGASGGNSSVEPANADGIDLDSCANVVLRDSVFYTNDDSIALKSGKDWFGRAVGVATQVNADMYSCWAR
jgi:polygalacturonase